MLICIGNDCYMCDNCSFGLIILCLCYVCVECGWLCFVFCGKSGQDQEVVLDNCCFVGILCCVQQLFGQCLFQYLDDDGIWQLIDLGLVNDYLCEVSGGEFIVKDFCIWGGIVQVIGVMVCMFLLECGGECVLCQVMIVGVKEVVVILGNMLVVCCVFYIYLVVFEGWCDGSLYCVVLVLCVSYLCQFEQCVLCYLC